MVTALNYIEAVNYIEDIPKFTTKNKLSHTRECLEMLGDPDASFQVIHVAGTNGKGSVCAFLASVLAAAGYRTGLFTSPHLVKINERFRIDGVDISDEEFLWAFEQVLDIAHKMVDQGSYHPTYFEFLFLMGMVIFREKRVEYVVLETGLGGRLDATNSVRHPLACIIASIGLDHTEYLGDTLEAIAGEKAGIIKKGAVVVYDDRHPSVSRVIEAAAKEQGCEAFGVAPSMYEILRNTPTSIDFSLKNRYYDNTTFTVPYIAPYQVVNASLAISVLGALQDKVSVSTDRIKKGIAETAWEGRMETVLPGVIVDGAHNEDGICRFIETAQHFHDDYEITLLFSAVVEKDYRSMIRDICQRLRLQRVVTTQIEGPREVPAEELADIFRANGCSQVEALEKVPEAFAVACERRGEGLLFCVGSLYLVGEIKDCIRSKTDD